MAPGGYRWWYIDALSDDGQHGLTVIVFIGSVFSPYYAAARRSAAGGLADPTNHCAVNVALYDRRGGHRWAMTERGRADLQRSEAHLQIGPSALAWSGDTLTLTLDEITVPWPSRIRGTVRLRAPAWTPHPLALDSAGRHHWSVLAPCAQVDVALGSPGLTWSGPAYMDSNWGSESLERGFLRWDWSRARLRDDSTVVFYDVLRADGTQACWGRRFDASGASVLQAAPDSAPLPRTGWGVQRHARSDEGRAARVAATLENGPFYARSLVEAQWFGEPVTAFHESVSLQRFDARWVQTLLPFRMPRRAR